MTLRATLSAMLFALALGSPAGYYALGDSMASGIGATPAQAFPVVLAQDVHVPVANLSITGAMTSDVLEREARAVDKDAALVTIDAGIIDVLAVYKRAETLRDARATYRRLVALVHSEAPQARIVLVTVIDRTKLSRTSVGRVPLRSFAQIRAITTAFNATIESLGYPVCEIGAAYYTPSNFVPDGFHPSLRGARYIARCIRDALQRPPPAALAVSSS